MDVQAPTNVPSFVESVAHGPAISYSIIDVESAIFSRDFGAATLSYALWLPPGIEMSGGGRLGFGDSLVNGACVEGFAALAFAPHFRTLAHLVSWRPATGVEIGLSSIRLTPPQTVPSTSFTAIELRNRQPGAFYAELTARPLRFQITELDVSVLGLAFGGQGAAGEVLRVQVELLQIGLSL